MSALAIESEPGNNHGWDELVRLWEQTDVPEGSKVEIIEGVVTVSPTPNFDHGFTIGRTRRILYTAIPENWELVDNISLVLPARRELYVPDVLVVDDEYAGRGVQTLPAEVAKLVVEVTSPSNGNHDRITKVHGYAQAGVPLYLLLDPWHSGMPSATLYGEPDNGTYRVLDVVKYGEPIRLPAPFDLTIDTGEFPVS